jgi:RNA polymerase sigma-70 factor (sigma-E family)
MEAAPGDDRAEFVAFVRAHQHVLVRRAYLVCGEQQMAEDLVQDALVKLALRWPHVRDGDPEAFLRTVIYRDAVSWWRRRRRELLTAAPPEPRPPDGGGDDVALRLAFEHALARLTVKQRAVLVLRYYDDLTEARTAEVLGVSIGTVKSQTSVALRRLRELAAGLDDVPRAEREA